MLHHCYNIAIKQISYTNRISLRQQSFLSRDNFLNLKLIGFLTQDANHFRPFFIQLFALFAMQGDQPFCTIFLFINSASGGGIGNTILSHEAEKIEFNISLTKNGESKLIYVYFFDMLTKRARAFKLLKETTEKGRKAIGIVCGGDGTIIWVVSQMYNHTIDPSKVAIGILPLGTGNDFSQNLGWGKEKTAVTQSHYRHLKKLIRKWLVAKEEYFDIWDVVAEVHERGKFEKINKQSQSQEIEGKAFRRSFCNYFSFGIDGKVGYSFDKRRTNSRIGNLMVYGAMGLLKSATRTKTLKELVQKMEIRHQFGDEVIEIEGKIEPPKEHIKSRNVAKSLQNSKIQTPDHNHSVIFSSIKNTEQGNMPILQSDYYNLLVLNIDSYMGGVKNIWNNAKSKEMINNKHKFHQQLSNDGEVEILGFSSSAGLALQRLIGGFGSKIAQGSGPFYITFKEYKEQKHRTYLQIDGEFIRFTHPKSIIIRKSYLSPTGQIRVLRKNPAAEEE